MLPAKDGEHFVCNGFMQYVQVENGHYAFKNLHITTSCDMIIYRKCRSALVF